MDCEHYEAYQCPNCGGCFQCDHIQKTTDVIWWVCKDGTMIRMGSSGQILEQIKPMLGKNKKKKRRK